MGIEELRKSRDLLLKDMEKCFKDIKGYADLIGQIWKFWKPSKHLKNETNMLLNMLSFKEIDEGTIRRRKR